MTCLILCISGSCRSDVKKENLSASRNAGSSLYDVSEDISIHQAAIEGKTTVVKKLLEKGIDVNITDEDGRTPLMYASYNGHQEVMRLLIGNGAVTDLQDNYGRTALMMASSGPFPSAVKLLLDHGSDPNITDKEEHYSALMYAAAEGQSDNVKILLAYRADPSLKDADGEDAMVFAAKNGHTEIVTLLNSFLQQSNKTSR